MTITRQLSAVKIPYTLVQLVRYTTIAKFSTRGLIPVLILIFSMSKKETLDAVIATLTGLVSSWFPMRSPLVKSHALSDQHTRVMFDQAVYKLTIDEDIPEQHRSALQVYTLESMDAVLSAQVYLSETDTPEIRHGIMETIPLLDSTIMATYVLAVYAEYLDGNANGITPEHCATQLAQAIPVRNVRMYIACNTVKHLYMYLLRYYSIRYHGLVL